MKKILYILLFIILFVQLSFAQTEIDIAKTHLQKNTQQLNLSSQDINEMVVSSAYLSPTTGWYHVYFNQTFQSIEVYNAMLNAVVQNGQVAYSNNNFVADLPSKIPAVSFASSINPMQAIQKAAENLNLKPSNISQIQSLNTSSLASGFVNKGSYFDANLSNEKIEVKLYWLLPENPNVKGGNQKMSLVWNVKFMGKDGKNSWNSHIDAFSGNVLKVSDDIIHCDFGTPEQIKVTENHLDNKQELNQSNLVSPNSYAVFDYPLESPNHGSQTLVSSPYTKFAPTGTGPGSTNGWHDDGTTSFTNTKGNNVDAKDDIANNDEVTIGSSPNSATLDFNYAYTQATGTAAANLNAAITNLFYWNNLMHDVLWKYGFDEPSGNFQRRIGK
jgi:Fungalysin metallopeptidase (M36)/Fungalysin/Thermolysin Propeptide Motif